MSEIQTDVPYRRLVNAAQKQKARIPDGFAEYAGALTVQELSARFDISAPSARKYAALLNINPPFRCDLCGKTASRERCASQRRCVECNDRVLAGTHDKPKRCSACKETKPYHEFSLTRAAGRLPIAQMHCKACSIGRLSGAAQADPDKLDDLSRRMMTGRWS